MLFEKRKIQKRNRKFRRGTDSEKNGRKRLHNRKKHFNQSPSKQNRKNSKNLSGSCGKKDQGIGKGHGQRLGKQCKSSGISRARARQCNDVSLRFPPFIFLHVNINFPAFRNFENLLKGHLKMEKQLRTKRFRMQTLMQNISTENLKFKKKKLPRLGLQKQSREPAPGMASEIRSRYRRKTGRRRRSSRSPRRRKKTIRKDSGEVHDSPRLSWERFDCLMIIFRENWRNKKKNTTN